MKTVFKVLLVSSLAASLSACMTSTVKNQNRFMKRIIKERKLKNGQILKIGYRPTIPSMQCRQIKQYKTNWSLQETASMFTLNTGYERMYDKAVKYANRHPQSGINYAYIFIPNQTSYDGFNADMFKKAYITYYQCKYPPAIHNSPF